MDRPRKRLAKGRKAARSASVTKLVEDSDACSIAACLRSTAAGGRRGWLAPSQMANPRGSWAAPERPSVKIDNEKSSVPGSRGRGVLGPGTPNLKRYP